MRLRLVIALELVLAVGTFAQYSPPGGGSGSGCTTGSIIDLLQGNGSGACSDSGLPAANVTTTYFNTFYPQLAAASTYSAGALQTFTPSATTAGLRVVPGAIPSAPNSGSVMFDSSGNPVTYDGTNVNVVPGLAGSGTTEPSAPTPGKVIAWASNYKLTSATAANIVSLFSTCSGTQYLGADGACHNATGGSPGGSSGQMQFNSSSSFGGLGSFIVANANSATETLTYRNQAAGSPLTTFAIVEGASQGNSPILNIFAGDASTSIWSIADGGGTKQFGSATFNAIHAEINVNSQFLAVNSGGFGLSSSSSSADTGLDTEFCRNAANLAGFTNGTDCSTAANFIPVKMAAVEISGTAFTVSGCGTAGSITGGATAGTFTVGTGASPCTFTITPGLTAAHGWVCHASDRTSGIDLPETTGGSATTCVVKGNAATSDVISFVALGF